MDRRSGRFLFEIVPTSRVSPPASADLGFSSPIPSAHILRLWGHMQSKSVLRMLEGLQPMTKVLAPLSWHRNEAEQSVRRPTCTRTLATVAAGLVLLAAVLLSTNGTP